MAQEGRRHRQKGDVLFEIETDKAVLEAESFFDGTLLKILVGEGETVPVSSVVAYVGEPGEKVPERAAARRRPQPRAEAAPAGRRRGRRRRRRPAAPAAVPAAAAAVGPGAGRARRRRAAPRRLHDQPARAAPWPASGAIDPAR